MYRCTDGSTALLLMMRWLNYYCKQIYSIFAVEKMRNWSTFWIAYFYVYMIKYFEKLTTKSPCHTEQPTSSSNQTSSVHGQGYSYSMVLDWILHHTSNTILINGFVKLNKHANQISVSLCCYPCIFDIIYRFRPCCLFNLKYLTENKRKSICPPYLSQR